VNRTKNVSSSTHAKQNKPPLMLKTFCFSLNELLGSEKPPQIQNLPGREAEQTADAKYAEG